MQKDEIQQLAELARVGISDAEAKELQKEMESVLGYVEQISKVATGGDVPNAGEYRNVVREDGDPHEAGAYTEELLAEAPEVKDGYVKVKKIL